MEQDYIYIDGEYVKINSEEYLNYIAQRNAMLSNNYENNKRVV